MEEEKIIRESLNTHTKQDIICYVGMGLLFIMIFIPPLFRIVFYDAEANKPKPEIILLNLKCRRSAYRDNYKLVSNIDANYTDSVPQTIVIDFSYEKEGAIEDIPEVNELLSIKENEGITVEKIENGYKFTLDYAHHDLNQIEELKQYGYLAPHQMNLYEDMNYYCETSSETVVEDE